jgi:hypothetical protein
MDEDKWLPSERTLLDAIRQAVIVCAILLVLILLALLFRR